jgi:hypothetical protein
VFSEIDGGLFSEIRIEDGYRPRKRSVKGEKPRNGRAFLEASVAAAVGVVAPLAGGVLPSAGRSLIFVTFGVLDSCSTGDSAREDVDSKSDTSDMGELGGSGGLSKASVPRTKNRFCYVPKTGAFSICQSKKQILEVR